VTQDISALLTVYCLDVEEPTPFTKEKAGYWLGVAHNVGVALTYHILADNSQQVIQRSVVSPWRDAHGANRRVSIDPNLDPAVALHEENQNIGQNPMTVSMNEIPVERWHRRHRRVRTDRGGRGKLWLWTTGTKERSLQRKRTGGILPVR
jgi:hypothetical protein